MNRDAGGEIEMSQPTKKRVNPKKGANYLTDHAGLTEHKQMYGDLTEHKHMY